MKSHRTVTRFFLTGLLSLVPPIACGEEPSAEPVEEGGVFDFLNPTHDYWSEKVTDYAGRLDRFFGDDRNFQDTNDSVVQLDFAQSVKESGDHETAFSGRAKLALPLTKKRLHVMVETDPEEEATGEITETGPIPPGEIASPDSYAAAMRYQNDEEDHWRFSADTGVKLRSTLDTYTRVRGSGSAIWGQWRFTLTETLFWFRTLGPGETTRMDIERAIADSMLLRSGSNATWLHDEKSYTLRQDLSLYHTVDSRRALVYQVSVLGTTQPVKQADEYIVLLRYRHRLHRDWLYAEVSPQMHYPIELDYHPDPQLVFGVEMLFGGKLGR